jgi:rhodanese-related sulfurtransferase
MAFGPNFGPADVEANRAFFAAKLRAEKQKADVVKAVKDGLGKPFLLLDVRSRDAFRKAHIQGAWCVPAEELAALVPLLPRDQELVTYCWNDY